MTIKVYITVTNGEYTPKKIKESGLIDKITEFDDIDHALSVFDDILNDGLDLLICKPIYSLPDATCYGADYWIEYLNDDDYR